MTNNENPELVYKSAWAPTHGGREINCTKPAQKCFITSIMEEELTLHECTLCNQSNSMNQNKSYKKTYFMLDTLFKPFQILLQNIPRYFFRVNICIIKLPHD